MLFIVAEKFGKFVHEVEDLSPSQLAEYDAYLTLKAEAEAKAHKAAREKAKREAKLNK